MPDRNKAGRLYLSSHRKTRKGKSLAVWRNSKRQKELAAQREAGPSINDSSNTANNEENLSPEELTSNNINNPVLGLPQDSITEVVYSVLQNIVSQACTAVKDCCRLSVAECACKSYNISQTASNNDLITLPLLTSTDTLTSRIPQNVNSSQIAASSCVTENHILPVTKSSVESSNTTQTISNNDTFPRPLLCSTCSSPVVSSAIQSTSTGQVISNDKASIPPKASTFAIPGIEISRPRRHLKRQSTFEKLEFLKVYRRQNKRLKAFRKQAAAKRQKTTQNNVATPINFDDVNVFETGTKKNSSKRNQPAATSRRVIIDFEFFFKKLKRANNHSLFGCNLNNMAIKKVKNVGICTSYNLKCVECGFETCIWSESLHKKNNLNNDFVSGMLSINCSFDAMNKLLTAICLPELKHTDFMREQRKIARGNKDREKKYQSTSKDISQENMSSASDKNNFLEKVNQGGLLIKDQFEINEENEPEFELPVQTMGASDDKLNFDQEQVTLNMAAIKQEINSHLNNDKLICPMNNEIKTPNKERPIENDKQCKAVSIQSNEVRPSENINKELATSDMAIIKQEISLHLDDEELTNSEDDENCLTEKDKQSKILLSQQQKVGTCKNRMIANREHVNLHKNRMIEKISQGNNRFVGHEFNNMRRIDEENITDIQKPPDLELLRMFTDKLNNSVDIQKIPTTTTELLQLPGNIQKIPTAIKKENLFRSNFETSVTATSSTYAGSAMATPPIMTIRDEACLKPMQLKSKSNRYDAMFIPQISHRNKDAILNVNDNSRQSFTFPAFPGGYVPNIPVSAVGTGTDAILKVNEYNRQCFRPTTFPGNYVPSVLDTNEKTVDHHDNVQQITAALQNSTSSIVASKHLSNVKMKDASSAFPSYSGVQYGATYAGVPSYLSKYREVMGYVNSEYSMLSMPDSDSPLNSKQTFQMPSVSSRSSHQAAQQCLPLQSQVEHQNHTSTFSSVSSATEHKQITGKKRKRCGQCPGCQTKVNCGMCATCINVKTHKICKMRKCEQLQAKKQPVLTYTSL